MIDKETLLQEIERAGFTGFRIPTMAAICEAESGRNEFAVNVIKDPKSVAFRSQDTGLFQINSYWWEAVFGRDPLFLFNAFDPIRNIYMAKQVYDVRFHALFSQTKDWYQSTQYAYEAWNVYKVENHKKYLREYIDFYNSL